jgi:hypothetical protein
MLPLPNDKPLKVRRKRLEHRLRIAVTAHCQLCSGTGLQLRNAYENFSNCLEVRVRVCPCVLVVIE